MEHVHVAILGTGFGGIASAIKLQEAGYDDFVVLERASDLGGTWRDNSYPGCACDVPSHLYSFSFAPNPAWTRSFSPQPEIWDYLRSVADNAGVMKYMRFDHMVTGATWVEEQAHWLINTTQGDITANFVVAATGGLSDPKTPDIAGVETFAGKTFHSATWDHEYDLTGKRVAVIGTGASSIQFVPKIQKQVAHLDLYQRTAPWIQPRLDRQITKVEHWLFTHIPVTQKIARLGIYWSRESLVLAYTRNQRLFAPLRFTAWNHRRSQIKDPVLRRKVTPNYALGCKRQLISNDYYPALTKPNVDVITEGIREVKAHSIVTSDGIEREVDALIFGTGFHVTDFPAAQFIRGRGGVSLADAWTGGVETYLGTSVSGFPNLFFIAGPNTGLGHNSMVFMIESHVAYLVDALKTIEASGAHVVDVRRTTMDGFNDKVQERMKSTVWLRGGCSSWYLDEKGRNVTLWPWATWVFRRRTARFDPAHYELTAHPAGAEPVKQPIAV